MICVCGQPEGMDFAEHADWCAADDEADPLRCDCYDFATMEYGPGYPCERCRALEAGAES